MNLYRGLTFISATLAILFGYGAILASLNGGAFIASMFAPASFAWGYIAWIFNQIKP